MNNLRSEYRVNELLKTDTNQGTDYFLNAMAAKRGDKPASKTVSFDNPSQWELV